MSKRKACCKCGHLPEEDGSEVEEIPDENVTPNKRAKKTTTTYFDRDFDAATTKNLAHAEKHLCSKYGLKSPLAGDLDLVYKGEETRGKGIITATSIVNLTWKLTYQPFGHRGSIIIKGETPVTTKARLAIAGTVQVPKSVAMACMAAYILENLASKQEHVSFLKKHPSGVKILAIGVAREVSTIPACRKLIEEETSGKHVAKDYIICADVSPTKVLCHPGPNVLRGTGAIAWSFATIAHPQPRPLQTRNAKDGIRAPAGTNRKTRCAERFSQTAWWP